MSVSEDDLLLHALADQELDAAASLDLERRMAAEPALAAAYNRILALKAAVSGLERPSVSPDFYERMAGLASPKAAVLSAARRAPRPYSGGDWRKIAASLVVTAVLASGSTYLLMAPSSEVAMNEATNEAIIDGYRRSLLATSPVDVVSSDRHTVRPWFDAKLGLSPPTPDLASAGFPLVGGRVEVIDGKPVPTLVYRRGKHLITVVARPQPASKPTDRTPQADTVGGYNVVRWSGSGFDYWAVSDLDAGDLKTFADELAVK